MNELWNQLASSAGLSLTEAQVTLLGRYLDLLLQANARMNLTRITERGAAEVQHVGDALTLLPYLPKAAHRLADVGTGGGVPGIPLAIVLPGVQVTLIESTRKKADFLRETCGALGLGNVTVVNARAEDAGVGELRETFDVAAARAVGAMVWLAEWCLPLVKKGGKVLAMKGAKVSEELPAAARAIRILGGGGPVVHPVSLPGTEHHVIVEIAKVGRTDTRYPRAATIAKGKALP